MSYVKLGISSGAGLARKLVQVWRRTIMAAALVPDGFWDVIEPFLPLVYAFRRTLPRHFVVLAQKRRQP